MVDTSMLKIETRLNLTTRIPLSGGSFFMVHQLNPPSRCFLAMPLWFRGIVVHTIQLHSSASSAFRPNSYVYYSPPKDHRIEIASDMCSFNWNINVKEQFIDGYDYSVSLATTSTYFFVARLTQLIF